MQKLRAHIVYGVEENILDPMCDGLYMRAPLESLCRIKEMMDKALTNRDVVISCRLEECCDKDLRPRIGAGRRRVQVSFLHFVAIPLGDKDWQFYVKPTENAPNEVRVFCSAWISNDIGEAIASYASYSYEIRFWPTRNYKMQKGRRADVRTQMGLFWLGGVRDK